MLFKERYAKIRKKVGSSKKKALSIKHQVCGNQLKKNISVCYNNVITAYKIQLKDCKIRYAKGAEILDKIEINNTGN